MKVLPNFPCHSDKVTAFLQQKKQLYCNKMNHTTNLLCLWIGIWIRIYSILEAFQKSIKKDMDFFIKLVLERGWSNIPLTIINYLVKHLFKVKNKGTKKRLETLSSVFIIDFEEVFVHVARTDEWPENHINYSNRR